MPPETTEQINTRMNMILRHRYARDPYQDYKRVLIRRRASYQKWMKEIQYYFYTLHLSHKKTRCIVERQWMMIDKLYLFQHATTARYSWESQTLALQDFYDKTHGEKIQNIKN